MNPITNFSLVSPINTFDPVRVMDQFHGTCLGADDDWLLEEGYARVANAADYSYDSTTHQLTAITPAYDSGANVWNTYQITAIPTATILATAAAAKCAAIDALLNIKLETGAHWNGTLFQIDPVSQTKFAGAGAAALAVVSAATGALPWPSVFYWIAADNSHVNMTAAQCFAFTQTMGQAITALVLTARGIKDACLAASSLASLNAIDITQNWPTV